MAKIKEIFKKHEAKIALAAGLVLLAAISFEAGIMKGKTAQENPILIEKASENVKPETQIQLPAAPAAAIHVPSTSVTTDSQNSAIQKISCAFVGSKNSDIYHFPDCPSAKRIKPENLVCFKSEQDAESKGYKQDKSCIK